MSDPSGSTRARCVLAAALLAVLTCALVFLLRGVQQVDDSMSYAVSIKTGWRLYHPHHLLFGPIVRALWLPLRGTVDAIGATQIHNAFWAALTVVAVLSQVRGATGSLALGAAAGVLLLSTFGFLTYCVQVEVYVPATACFTLLVLAVTGARGNGPGALSSGRRVLAALLLALSIFYHQTSVLLCVPLTMTFLICRGAGGWRGAARSAAVVVGGAGLLVLAVYVAAYVVEPGPASPSGFVEHALGYATTVDTTRAWGTMDNVSLQGLEQLLHSQLLGFVTPQRAGLAGAGWVLGGAIALLVAWNAARARADRGSRGLRCLLLGWLAMDYAFFLWWQPFQPEFFVATLVPLVGLGALSLADLVRAPAPRSALAWAMGALALLLLVDNLRELRTRVGTPGRDAGEAYLALVPRDCVHLGYRNLIQTLRYEFDVDPERSHNVTQARRRALHGEDVGAAFPLPVDGCVVVPGNEVLPRRKQRDGAQAWLGYYAWLFRLAPLPDGVRGPAVSVVAADGGPFYLVQGPATERYEDLGAFFAALDGALAGRAGGAAFTRWFEANSSGLSLQD